MASCACFDISWAQLGCVHAVLSNEACSIEGGRNIQAQGLRLARTPCCHRAEASAQHNSLISTLNSGVAAIPSDDLDPLMEHLLMTRCSAALRSSPFFSPGEELQCSFSSFNLSPGPWKIFSIQPDPRLHGDNLEWHAGCQPHMCHSRRTLAPEHHQGAWRGPAGEGTVEAGEDFCISFMLFKCYFHAERTAIFPLIPGHEARAISHPSLRWV